MAQTLFIPQYGPDGALASVILADPEDETQWLRLELDELVPSARLVVGPPNASGT